MKNFCFKSILFWFVLLAAALLNATVRELTYKPFLEPYIGTWAHQISSLTGIVLFFVVIYIFLKKNRASYKKNDLFFAGTVWLLMTLIFEFFMNFYIRHLSFQEIVKTYYFWQGETWLFVLLSLFFLPILISVMIEKNKTKQVFRILILILELAVLSILAIIFLKNDQVGRVVNNSEEAFLAKIQAQYEESKKGMFVVSGKFVCLPVKDENIPHNDLCVFSIKDDQDNYYRLQTLSNENSNVLSKIKIGQNLEVYGTLIDEENDLYISAGTIKIAGIKHLPTPEENLIAFLPKSFKVDYISFQNYSTGIYAVDVYPRLEFWVEDGLINCEESAAESSLPLRTGKFEINGRKYCMAAFSEGAAGSVYTEYHYATVISDKVYSIGFIARYVNCGNYPDQERLECEKERETFDLNRAVDVEISRLASDGELKYFGNEVEGDFNKDGFDDMVFLSTAQPGGSGTFFYLLAALGSEKGKFLSEPVFLGDRIAPQSSEYIDGKIIINYAERQKDESFADTPSIGVSRYFTVNDNFEIVEIK